MAGFSFIPFPPWALFFCFVPLWYFCLQNSNNFKRILIAGWLCQFFISSIGFCWVAYTISHYGELPWFIGVIGFVLFSSFAHLHIPIALMTWYFLIHFFIFNNKHSRWILLPTLSAFFFSFLPMLFKWNFGYPWLWARFPAFQTAEIWGFEFLSTLTFFFQLVFLSWFYKKLFKKSLIIGIFIFIGLNIFGYSLVYKKSLPTQTARILMVQHNIGNYVHSTQSIRKLFQKTTRLLNQMTQETLRHQDPVDFIVWPEGAYPYLISKTRTPFRTQYLQKTVKEKFQTNLITGGTTEQGGNFTNSIFFINSQGKLYPKRYDKNYLLAFGEYIPAESWFPFIREFFLGSRRRLIAGNEIPALRIVEGIKLGVQICYEGLKSSFARKAAKQGAQILLNVTNDSWFGRWLEPKQHLYLTLGRVIETRRPMIRLSTVGHSVAMDALGNILAHSPLHKEWTQIVELPYEDNPEPTLFVRWGYHINYLFLILIFLSLTSINIYIQRFK